MASAMRSLTDPPGLRCSHLARTGTGSPAPMRTSRTRGVPPMRSRMAGAALMGSMMRHRGGSVQRRLRLQPRAAPALLVAAALLADADRPAGAHGDLGGAL